MLTGNLSLLGCHGLCPGRTPLDLSLADAANEEGKGRDSRCNEYGGCVSQHLIAPAV